MTSRVGPMRILVFILIFSALNPLSPNATASSAAMPFAQSSAGETSTAATEIPAGLTKDQIDALVARLSDQEVRNLLLRQLDKTAVAEIEPDTSVTAMSRFIAGLNRAEADIKLRANSMGEVVHVPGRIWRYSTEGSAASPWFVVLQLVLYFAIGAGVERLFRHFMSNVAKQAPPAEPLPFGSRLKLGCLRALMDVIAIVVFVFGTVVAWMVFDLPTENANVLFTLLLSGVLILRLVAVISRLVLAPKLAWLRLASIDDAAADTAHSWLMLVAGIAVLASWWAGEIMRGFGFDSGVTGAVSLITSAIFIITIITMIWRLKPRDDAVPDNAPGQDYLTSKWPVLSTIAVLFIYALALAVSFTTGERVLNQAIGSLLFLGAIPFIDMGLRGWINGFFRERELGETFEAATAEAVEAPEPEATPLHTADVTARKSSDGVKSYDRVIVNNIRILLFLLAVFVFAGIWDLQVFGFLKALVGERTVSILLNISITGLIAYALWGIVSTAVARIAGPEPEPGVHGDGDGGGGGGTRLGTVLPLFKKFLFISMIVMLVMIVLSSLGVDIGPLIAGAGILGIAIGFGAQTLVKDIVSGLFFLLDDAFRVGEYVTIGSTKGTVEKISVRSLRLRHHNGPLHTVPFGEIQTLTNWSRDWAIMKFEIRVPFETDVDVVRRLIKKVGQQMLEDEELAPFFLEPLKSQGVNRMDDSSFIIRCKFTATPGNQFYLRREAYMRIQRAFEEKGIKFAPRRVIVETTAPAGSDAAAAAGAAGALDTPGTQQDHGKDEPG